VNAENAGVDVTSRNGRTDDDDMSVEAQIERQRYSQQTELVTSYYGVRTELENWKTTVFLGKTVSRSDPQRLSLVRVELEAVSRHPTAVICDALFQPSGS